MRKYFVRLTTQYQLEDGSYGKILTEPTDYYQKCCKQYEDIVARINNKVVLSEREIPYKDGYYDPFFQIEMVSQNYSNGRLSGYVKCEKGHIEIYLGKYEPNSKF